MNDETMREAFEKWLHYNADQSRLINCDEYRSDLWDGWKGAWEACEQDMHAQIIGDANIPTAIDDLEFRLIDAEEERDHLRNQLTNTRAKASAPEGGEAVGEIVDVFKPVCSRVVMFDGDLPIGTRLYTRSNAKAGEVDGQVLPKGWNIEVRTANGKHALCVFGPDGCFAVHGDTDHKSDIRVEVIDQLRIALSTHDKTKA